ncbi:MAG: restriction endonuclease [Terriglobia bacterium]|nr:restriction endonuclease [Terriglobia bacterium]
MPIPDYQSVMLPLLEIAADGKEHYIRNAIVDLSAHFKLSESDRKELLPSGTDTIFDNRVGWARTYLKKAGLIQYVRRGYFQITDRGQTALSKKPAKIDVAFLRQYPEFAEFWSPKKTTGDRAPENPAENIAQTPEEAISEGYLKLRKQVESDILTQVKICPPEFFERLVVRLLTAIGYGGSLSDAGKAIGRSGDGGIDGVIKEDKLGLDLLYIQAKRWGDNTVGRPEIQGFVGALYGKKAKRGIFITTSTFSKAALDYAEGLDSRVVLINGAQLAELMFEYGLGVSTVSSYVVKRVDSDFFNEDDGSGSVTDSADKMKM